MVIALTPVAVTLVAFIATIIAISGLYVIRLGFSRLVLLARSTRLPR